MSAETEFHFVCLKRGTSLRGGGGGAKLPCGLHTGGTAIFLKAWIFSEVGLDCVTE